MRLNGERTTSGDRPVDIILILAQDSSQIDTAIEQVERVLREERGIEDGEDDDFRVFSASAIAESLTSTVRRYLHHDRRVVLSIVPRGRTELALPGSVTAVVS